VHQSLRPTNICWKDQTPNASCLSWHPQFGVSLPSQPLVGTQPGQALNQPWGCANKQVPLPSPPPWGGLPCCCRNIDPDQPGRHIRCPGGVGRSVAQLAARRPMPAGSGMGKGSTEGLGKPLTPPRGPGPKCFCQGVVKQIDEGPL